MCLPLSVFQASLPSPAPPSPQCSWGRTLLRTPPLPPQRVAARQSSAVGCVRASSVWKGSSTSMWSSVGSATRLRWVTHICSVITSIDIVIQVVYSGQAGWVTYHINLHVRVNSISIQEVIWHWNFPHCFSELECGISVYFLNWP